MKKLLEVIIIIFLPIISNGQDFQAKFQACIETRDTICQEKILQEWEIAKPEDAELYTSYFNYHFIKARKEVLVLTTNESNGEGFELKDSADQTAGFLGSQTYFDSKEVKNGIDKINAGIQKYPNRLDMRFGKIYVLGVTENWENYTNEIIKTVAYSITNKNDWTWTNNKKQEGGETFFLSSIQNYQVQLYDTGNDSLLLNMRKIATAVLNHYPNHIESLSNLSITYLLLGEFDKAIDILLKAEKLNPEDYIILSNIAHAYKLKGDKAMAIEYYEKTIKFGDEEAKIFAKQQIEKLKN